MQELDFDDKSALGAQLEDAQKRLDGLEQELRFFDAELAALSTEGLRVEQLAEVCGALEKLRDLGGADLFWDGRGLDDSGEHHVRLVRLRVDEFHKRISEIESNRRSIFEKMQLAQDDTDFIEEEALELQRKEEQRKLEWLIEREINSPPARPSIMPWGDTEEETARLRKSMGAALLVSLLLGVLLPLVDLPLRDRDAPVEVPERQGYYPEAIFQKLRFGCR